MSHLRFTPTWRGGACLMALLVAQSMATLAWQDTNSAGNHAAKANKNPVQEIELPSYPPDLPPGPNFELFQQRCLLCHSARYVTMQPRFSQAVWEKEVKKMVDVYGAPIPAADQPGIVEYLVAIRGPEKGK